MLVLPAVLGLLAAPCWAATTKKKKPRAVRSSYRVATYANSTEGDYIDGDVLPVRRAAVEALGGYNGSVVVVDPGTGRVLTIVNQKLAFGSGFTPCSTIKLVTAFAALREGLVARDTRLKLGRRTYLDLTQALAKSNNPYFAVLGNALGFERISHYARLFGLGEKAGLEIASEQPGTFPESPPQWGSLGLLTSFGEGISLTPLELAGMLAAISNGGVLYYLQYPRNEDEIVNFVPRVKRDLGIAPWIADVKEGMRGAVEFGTATRAAYDAGEPLLGKTGTCTDFRHGAHLGWFGAFTDGRNPLAVVVLLTGGRSVNGPVAAGVAGAFFRNLGQQNYLARNTAVYATACCSR